MKNLFLFFFPFLLILILFNFWVKSKNFPDYGSWTGMSSLELKLKLYEEFSKEGENDFKT